MHQELKKEILNIVYPFVDEWIQKIDAIQGKKGWASVKLDVEAVLQEGRINRITANDEHFKLKQEGTKTCRS